MSGDLGPTSAAPHPGEIEPGSGVRIVVEYCEPCGFEATYLELASAVKEQYPGIEIESRLGGTGAFEIEINGQLVFSKLENGGFPYEKDVSICNVGSAPGSLCLCSVSSHSVSLPSSSLRPSEEPVMENP
ncbi:PREDICTED: migration and invasion enhancer 1 isoform X1 [Miniopterus natalensis]|uniref:migration and invasion enhancer 1 isoform X1 n=1 Tax=Miniopterus natalensis TaxID=291302 RepID=UPI0007A72E36|nr:PREDICTED: migration and invasion enhancer 1 isoform X1 [Miniopterus natalensis]